MELAELKAFLAVAKHGSFSEAAEALHLTQPAVSKRIAALEAHLETRLFDRAERKIHITEAGQLLLKNATTILNAVDTTEQAIANLSSTISGALTIGTSHHIGLRRLPPILRQYSKNFPDVQLNIQFMTSEAGWEAVEQGELELAIVTLPEIVSPKLTTFQVWNDPLAVVAAKGHKIHKKKAGIATLAKYPAVLPERSSHTRSMIDSVFMSNKLPLNVALETNYLETIMMMASVGLGWSVLPTTMLNKDLLTIEISELTLQRQLGIAHNKNRTLSNSAQAMIDILTLQKDT